MFLRHCAASRHGTSEHSYSGKIQHNADRYIRMRGCAQILHVGTGQPYAWCCTGRRGSARSGRHPFPPEPSGSQYHLRNETILGRPLLHPLLMVSTTVNIVGISTRAQFVANVTGPALCLNMLGFHVIFHVLAGLTEVLACTALESFTSFVVERSHGHRQSLT